MKEKEMNNGSCDEENVWDLTDESKEMEARSGHTFCVTVRVVAVVSRSRMRKYRFGRHFWYEMSRGLENIDDAASMALSIELF
jgi:hypothetical protein